jgi:hypothetical protein
MISAIFLNELQIAFKTAYVLFTSDEAAAPSTSGGLKGL